jgi:hypothetical protein
MFAFLATAAAVKFKKLNEAARAKEVALPIFEPEWWFSRWRLDARPVIWSLLNHPEEWKETSPGVMFHTPSLHEFRLGYDRLSRPLGLLHAQCSCHTDTTNHFQHFQDRAVRRAWRRWKEIDQSTIGTKMVVGSAKQPYLGEYKPNHFAAHFVH